METPVSDYYKNKTIFITGATGFIGKVLMEKLLYSCSDLKKIYILVRQKRGKSVSTRMEEIFNLPMFSRLRRDKPETMRKVVPLDGDISSVDFGLKLSTIEKLYQEVNIIFHCAATLKLEANLKDAIEMNTSATYRLLQVSKEMSQLEVFVYLSTAFCYADYDVLDEEVHETTENPQDIMTMVRWMSNDSLNTITPMLLKFHPNTYTYSKRLSEILVRDEYPRLPVVIARPSIVIPSWEEPIPGWVDTLNGPVGVMVGAGKGVIRTMHCDGDSRAEVIPVDYAVSSLIVLTQSIASKKEKSPTVPVYNLTTNDIKVTTWHKVLSLARKTNHEYPLDFPLWYPDGNIHKSFIVHKFCVIFFHWIPAMLIDLLLFIFRQKRFMIRVQTRISLGLELLQFFTTRNWIFLNDKYKDLLANLTPVEKKKFRMDMSEVRDEEYFKRCSLGGRVYCLKEPLDTLPRARIVNKVMYVLDRTVKILFLMYILWTLYHYLEVIKYLLRPLPSLKSILMVD